MIRGDIWWYMISYLVIDQVTSPKPGCLAPNQPSRSATDMPTIRKSCLGKKRHFQTKRTACCFVLTRLHMHLLHLCMQKLSADHDPSYLFICLYIHRCFNLFICYLLFYLCIYLFIYCIHLFIYLCRCVHVLWFVEVLGLAKNPHKMALSGASPISKHIPNSMAARRRHSISRIYLSNTFDEGTQKKHPLESKNAEYDDLILWFLLLRLFPCVSTLTSSYGKWQRQGLDQGAPSDLRPFCCKSLVRCSCAFRLPSSHKRSAAVLSLPKVSFY